MKKISSTTAQNSLSVKKSVPLGIRNIAALCFLSIVFIFLFGTFLILGIAGSSAKFYEAGRGFFALVVSQIPILLVSTVPFFFLGQIFPTFGLMLLAFFIGRDLQKGKKWARNTAIIIAALFVISSLIGMFERQIIFNFPILLLNVAIIGYLFSNKEAKAFFAR